MAHGLIWAPTARLDLKALSTYIGASSPSAARRFVQGIFQAVERLRDFPLSGRIVPEFNDPGIREVLRKPCRIVYRVKDGKFTVEIIRIWHSARGAPEM